MTTDTSEKGLETVIIASLTGQGPDGQASGPATVKETGLKWSTPADYLQGRPEDYNREHALDLVKLLDFLNKTQPKVVESLGLIEDGPRRQQFLHRLQGEIAKRGIIDVLRNGVKHGPASVDLFYATPTPRSTGRANAT